MDHYYTPRGQGHLYDQSGQGAAGHFGKWPAFV